jgi:hypothetical protein
MASITIGITPPIKVNTSTEITGEEKLVTLSSTGKPVTITVNQILDKVDEDISDRVEDQVVDQIMETVDAKIEDRIEDRIDEAVDNANNLKWTNVYGQN